MMQRDSNDIDLYARMTAMSLGNTNRRTAMSLGNTNRRIYSDVIGQYKQKDSDVHV